MRSRATAIVVAVVVPLAALAGIVILRGDGSSGPSRLPINLLGRSETAGIADAALAPYGGVVYHAADGLPALDGKGRAYTLSGSIDATTATRIADAFGVQGEPEGDDYGGFSVTDGDAQVTVFPYGAGGWSYARSTSGGAVSSSGVAVACPENADCPAPATTIPERPANLPAQEDAKRIALDALQRAGIDTNGTTVSIDDLFSQWQVRVDPVIDGVPVEGFGSSVTIGGDGVVEYASGTLGTAQAADEYPLLGTAKAIDYLNQGKGFLGPIPLMARDVAEQAVSGGGTSAGSPGSAPATPAPLPAPDVPMPTQLPPCDGTGAPTTFPCTDVTNGTLPPPQQVTIIGAERILLAVPSYDGNDAFLVPGYRFRTADGTGPSVIAIDESYIAPPPATVPASDDVKTDPGSIEPSPPEVTIEPQPIPEPQEKPSTGG